MKIDGRYRFNPSLICETSNPQSCKPDAREAQAAALAERNKRLGLYFFSIVVAVTGVCYASVPLYKVFCQATGFGGTTKRVESLEDAVGSAPVRG